ncbi:MAG TPA: PAS domain-containing protein [Stellaceae bacterium]|nr:PAS domain-containing protein [Stellaceae bacterium]
MAQALDPFVKESPAPGDFHDSRLPPLLAYWERERGDAELPPVAAIDPTRLTFILGWLMIMEPVDGGADFLYRLYGSNVAAAFGRDLTGCRVGDSFPEVAQFVIAAYQRMLALRRPLLTRHRPPPVIPLDYWERLLLPFAAADGTVTRILVGTIAHGVRKVGRRPLPWPLAKAATG